uniref:Peptidase A2 domain-containing protein n=1 Tax=Pyrodinium bahamense TaxID=73915 RepID=A0A7S0A3R4_9DINO|mmetsp:Transcript_20716/g.57301  ORF Transcript_20716/g.57301 Transcript_20716/m.57301 type:complete len:191 (+) Transcript_20716:84-656(+)
MGSGLGHVLRGETELEREQRVYRKLASAKPGSLAHAILKLASCMGCMLPMAPPGGELAFVSCRLAGEELQMLVDTGAKRSVISSSLVQRLGLLGHLDRSIQGVSVGVGSAKITGRLRGVPLALGPVSLSVDFSVLDIEGGLLVLGLESLRQHRCLVDLGRQCLVFGGRSSGMAVPLLPPDPGRVPLARAR